MTSTPARGLYRYGRWFGPRWGPWWGLSAGPPARPPGAGAGAVSDGERVSFLHRALGPTFDKRVVTLEPGTSRPYLAHEWHDALVVVEAGEVELECADGGRRRFATGAVLWLAELGLLALHNDGPAPAVLVAVSRRRAPPGR
jgi:quercetin dioxygenase-like cupin family protein